MHREGALASLRRRWISSLPYGLTEAEVLAVKMFTVSNYEFINPATANKESWMKGQMFPKEKFKDEEEPDGEKLNPSPKLRWRDC